jgi:hypothetical protein
MPTIIKKGDLERAKPRHLRATLKCYTCGCVFRLDPGDRFSESDDQREGYSVTAKCPTCGKQASGTYSDRVSGAYYVDDHYG